MPLMGEGCLALGHAAQNDTLLEEKEGPKIPHSQAVLPLEENWQAILGRVQDISYALGAGVGNPQQNPPSFEILHSIGQAYREASREENSLNCQKYSEEGRLFFTYCASLFSFKKVPQNVQAISYMWLDFFCKFNVFHYQGGVPSYRGEMREKALSLDGAIGNFFDKFIEAHQQNSDCSSSSKNQAQISIDTNFKTSKDENSPQSFSPLGNRKNRSTPTLVAGEEGNSSPLPGCFAEGEIDFPDSLNQNLKGNN